MYLHGSNKILHRYNLDDGEVLCLGGVLLAKFKVPVLEQEDQEGDDNAVPETPVKATPSIRVKPSLQDQSFLPESSSSPLPSSVSAALKPSVFQVPESPSSDLNDSSFIIVSSQQVSSGKSSIQIFTK